MLSSVDLPLPDGPEQHDELAREQVEVHAAQRVHLDLAHPVDLGEVMRGKHLDRRNRLIRHVQLQHWRARLQKVRLRRSV